MKDENFYDLIGEEILSEKGELTVGDLSEFLAGSKGAFDFMMSSIGEIDGKTILDYGCGSGWLGVFLAKEGAKVKGFDISEKMIKVARKRAKHNGVENLIEFSKMTAENLIYPDNYFDFAVGVSILHHVDLDLAAKELKRVLKKEGKPFS